MFRRTFTPTKITPAREYNRAWIRLIWSHRADYKARPNQYVHVPFWRAVKATILLWLNLWVNELPKYDKDGDHIFQTDLPEVAWRSNGTYHTDYGTGHSFITLVIFGWHMYEYEDGDL